MGASTAGGQIRSVDRAVDLLELLTSENRGFGLGEIAARLELNASTAHHLVATLRERGFVRQDPKTRAYQIGYRLATLVTRYFAKSDTYTASIDAARALRDDSGETTYLTVLDGRRTATLIELPGNRAIQARRPDIAGDAQFHCTASGKVFLAWMEPATQLALLPTLRLERFTPNTIVAQRALEDELDQIRNQGYALDREENLAGIACVAAPVFNLHGDCVATISIARSAHQAAAGDCIGLVIAAASEISARLGYPGRPAEESARTMVGVA